MCSFCSRTTNLTLSGYQAEIIALARMTCHLATIVSFRPISMRANRFGLEKTGGELTLQRPKHRETRRFNDTGVRAGPPAPSQVDSQTIKKTQNWHTHNLIPRGFRGQQLRAQFVYQSILGGAFCLKVTVYIQFKYISVFLWQRVRTTTSPLSLPRTLHTPRARARTHKEIRGAGIP